LSLIANLFKPETVYQIQLQIVYWIELQTLFLIILQVANCLSN